MLDFTVIFNRLLSFYFKCTKSITGTYACGFFESEKPFSCKTNLELKCGSGGIEIKFQVQLYLMKNRLTFYWFPLKKLVFCYQNCSDLLWEWNVLVIKKNFWNSRLKAKNFQKIWTICSNSERSEKFLVRERFYNLFLEVNKLEQLEFKLEKIIGI